MSLATLFMDLAVRLQSSQFLQSARHLEHPAAFSRQRTLPLPTLVALMLTGMRTSIQAELDVFFGHLQGGSQLLPTVSEKAFAQKRAEQHGFVPSWCRLRMVAADASTMRFGLRARHVKRAALPDQILFGLFLPDAELMLAASLHSIAANSEQRAASGKCWSSIWLSFPLTTCCCRAADTRRAGSFHCSSSTAFRAARALKRLATAVARACAISWARV